MTIHEEQMMEIATIKERGFQLNLSDADMQRFLVKATAVGLTMEELLSSFIGDLVDGTYSNGSDERACAEDWFDRCGFAHASKQTFLRYLVYTDELGDVLVISQQLATMKETIAELESRLDEGGECQEKIQSLQEDMFEEQIYIDEVFLAFDDWSTDSHGSYEEEMLAVHAWRKRWMELMSKGRNLRWQSTQLS